MFTPLPASFAAVAGLAAKVASVAGGWIAVADPGAGPVKTVTGSKAIGVLGVAVLPPFPATQGVECCCISVSSTGLLLPEPDGPLQEPDPVSTSCSQVAAWRLPRRPQISACMSGGGPPTRVSAATLVVVPQPEELAKPLSRRLAVTTERTLAEGWPSTTAIRW